LIAVVGMILRIIEQLDGAQRLMSIIDLVERSGSRTGMKFLKRRSKAA
jgi:hypothetical protein